MTKNIVQTVKTVALSEREQLRELFTLRASQAPILSPFDSASLREWDEYVAEMQGLERMLKDAGDQL